MKINLREFRVDPGSRMRMGEWPTRVDPFYADEEDYKDQLQDGRKRMADAQKHLYASERYAVLIIFQAMDAAGKDSAIKHVMSGIDPQGCQVHSFKAPSAEELRHDFLWRTTVKLPERGRIGIFNRSYYEEALVTRIHPEFLEKQGVPAGEIGTKAMWKGRYRSINDLEAHLHRNGTRIVKICLHVSKEEQRKRLLARIDKPEKNWKFSFDDIEDRKQWPRFMRAYGECIEATSTGIAPWHMVPADDKRNARLIVSRIIVEALQGLRMDYPRLPQSKLRDLKAIRRLLER
jgi:PPK2 family polyphosphate:nucleotide phosphotransferase